MEQTLYITIKAKIKSHLVYSSDAIRELESDTNISIANTENVEILGTEIITITKVSDKSAKDILLERLKLIEDSPELTAKLREKYATDFAWIRVGIESNMIKPIAVHYIEKLTENIYN